MSGTHTHADLDPRFAGVARLYAVDGLERLRAARVCVIGLGGVGSWAVEALARTGVGHLTLVDLDEVCVSNVNRQLHAVAGQFGRAKADVMRDRVLAINPEADVAVKPMFFTDATADAVLGERYDYVLDAIDSWNHKVTLIAECRRRGQPLVVCGSAGGRRDASQVQVADLARTQRDTLLQIVRKKLRQFHGFPKKGGKRFAISAVFSPEQLVYPTADGCVSETRPEETRGKPLRLSCEQGLGAATFVTGTMGFVAAGVIVNAIANPEG